MSEIEKIEELEEFVEEELYSWSCIERIENIREFVVLKYHKNTLLCLEVDIDEGIVPHKIVRFRPFPSKDLETGDIFRINVPKNFEVEENISDEDWFNDLVDEGLYELREDVYHSKKRFEEAKYDWNDDEAREDE